MQPNLDHLLDPATGGAADGTPDRVAGPADDPVDDPPIDPAIDRRVAAHAGRQHGLFTLTQLRALGVTRSQIRTRVAAGRWIAEGPAVLRMNGTPVTWESEIMGAVLAAGPAAVVSHRAAAGLWGLDDFVGSEPELSIPRTQALGRREGVTVHRSGDLHLVEAEVRSGLPVTPVARTLLDLGAVLSRTEARRAVEDARRRGLVDWGELLDVLVTHARRGRNGIAPLRAVLDDRSSEVARAGRALERLVSALLTAASLPRPVPDHGVDDGEGGRVTVALAYPAARIALDLRGEGGGAGGRGAAGDGARTGDLPAVLGRAGWQVLGFDWHDYLKRPGRIVRQVRLALGGVRS